MFTSASMHWLVEAVAIRRDRVARMLRQMTGLGPRGGMTAPAFRKFLNLLNQIAAEQREEDRLMGRIAEVEAHHRYRRAYRQLPHAPEARPAPGLTPRPAAAGPDAAPKRARKRSLFWLALLVRAFMPRMK